MIIAAVVVSGLYFVFCCSTKSKSCSECAGLLLLVIISQFYFATYDVAVQMCCYYFVLVQHIVR